MRLERRTEMKKIIWVLPFVFAAVTAHAEMNLDQKIIALEKAVITATLKAQLPKRFADETKQAEFDANLKKAVAFLEDKFQVVPPDYKMEPDPDLSEEWQAMFDKQLQNAIEEQEATLLVYLLEDATKAMAELKGEALTQEENNAVYYAFYWLVKKGTNAQDYARYTKFMYPLESEDLPLEMVEQAMQAVFISVARIA